MQSNRQTAARTSVSPSRVSATASKRPRKCERWPWTRRRRSAHPLPLEPRHESNPRNTNNNTIFLAQTTYTSALHWDGFWCWQKRDICYTPPPPSFVYFVLLLALLSVVETSQPALLCPDVTLSNHNGLEYPYFSILRGTEAYPFFSLVCQALFGSPGLRFHSSAAHTFRPGPCTSKLHVSTPPLRRLLLPYPLLHTRTLFESSIAFSKSRLVASESAVCLAMSMHTLHVLSTPQYPSPVFVGITHVTFA
jgi:hypothetical protein